ncbi:cysteine-rich with EGF-like domain protein 2-A isoform X2 [Convolutriloba macropyga]|uniref:cysteine-rich with EGF-like domain protein 2-A isoform X2 n=1 Tax=Convolutriloba macropyga TaxID=536237 RepID=UPI003F521A47
MRGNGWLAAPKTTRSVSLDWGMKLAYLRLKPAVSFHWLLSVFYSILLLSFPLAVHANGAKLDGQCKDCRELVKMFIDEFKATDRGLYEGGDTDWEVKNLKEYRKSEVRLIEITDKIFGAKKSQLSRLLEQVEENLEEFWYSHWDHLNTEEGTNELEEYLCVALLKSCCPYGFFGPECTACNSIRNDEQQQDPGIDHLTADNSNENLASLICSGHGSCNGNGTRSGTGNCNCDAGHKAPFCEECARGYKREVDDDTTSACVDIDECSNPENSEICENGKYCANKPGYFACKKCHEACNGETCSGPDPDDCTGSSCAEGYELIPLEDDAESSEDPNENLPRGCRKIKKESVDGSDSEGEDDDDSSEDESSSGEDDDDTIYFDLESMGSNFRNSYAKGVDGEVDISEKEEQGVNDSELPLAGDSDLKPDIAQSA